MDHAGHTVKKSARQGGGFWKEIDGGVFERELAGRMILSTFTKCGHRPTVTWELECYELFEAGGARLMTYLGADELL